MRIKKMEKLYGEEMTEQLLKGMDWIAKFSCNPPLHKCKQYNPKQAIIAAALQALAMGDIKAFKKIHCVENLSKFSHRRMYSWLKDDHEFPKQVVARCLAALAWLVVHKRLSSKSHFVAAVIGLESKYELCGVFIHAVEVCVNHSWMKTRSRDNKKEVPDFKNVSTQTYFEGNETIVNPIYPAVGPNKTEMNELSDQGRAEFQQENIRVKTLLQGAIEIENAKTIDAFLKLNKKAFSEDDSISGLLNIAVKRKRIKIVRTLLWHGFNTQFLDEEGNAPLHIACSLNHLKMVKMLIFAGASVIQENGSGLLPLHLTAHPATIEYLLEKGTHVNARTPAGDTALHYAVSNCNKEAVETLMRYRANPNAINSNGLTPLLLALRTYNQEMVDLLTRCGAMVLALSSYGNELLQKAVEIEKEDINNNIEATPSLQALKSIQNSQDNNEIAPPELYKDGHIHKAAAEGRLEAVMALLDRGIRVDTKGYGGFTALQYAAKYGHLKVVQALLQREADINLGNDWNWTPLHHAAHYSRCDIAEFLIEAGADTQVVDSVYGKTPLSWATSNFKMIKLFRSKGINS